MSMTDYPGLPTNSATSAEELVKLLYLFSVNDNFYNKTAIWKTGVKFCLLTNT